MTRSSATSPRATAIPSSSCTAATSRPIITRWHDPTPSPDDQIRAEEVLHEFAELEKAGTVPQLSILALNSDHTNGTKPGSPTPRAMVADDDLALGRIVEGISKSNLWESSL